MPTPPPGGSRARPLFRWWLPLSPWHLLRWRAACTEVLASNPGWLFGGRRCPSTRSPSARSPLEAPWMPGSPAGSGGPSTPPRWASGSTSNVSHVSTPSRPCSSARSPRRSRPLCGSCSSPVRPFLDRSPCACGLHSPTTDSWGVMIPSRIERIGQLPRTVRGKVDRQVHLDSEPVQLLSLQETGDVLRPEPGVPSQARGCPGSGP